MCLPTQVTKKHKSNLSIGNWVLYSGMLLYLHHRNSKLLTTSKMRKFQTLKLCLHKAKSCWTENWWSSGIMSSFWGEFFCVLGDKIFFGIFFEIFIKNILASALKSCIKWSQKICNFLFLKLNRNYHHLNLSYTVLNPLYSESNKKMILRMMISVMKNVIGNFILQTLINSIQRL